MRTGRPQGRKSQSKRYNTVGSFTVVDAKESAATVAAINGTHGYTPAIEEAMWACLGLGTANLSEAEVRLATRIESVAAEDDDFDREPTLAELAEIEREGGMTRKVA